MMRKMKILKNSHVKTFFHGVCSKFSLRLVMLLFLCLVVFVTYTIASELIQPEYVYVNTDIQSECMLPKLDPFDPSMMKYYHKLSPIDCSKSLALMFVDAKGILRFNKTINKEQMKLAYCTYSTIQRVDDFKVNFEPEVKFVPPVDIPSDFFLVKCKDKDNKAIYEYLHAKVNFKNWTLSKNGKVPKPQSQEDFSVVIFGIDSLSQMAAYRTLPKSLNYLHNTLKGYVLKGFNKVGSNTHANMLPLFTGFLHETQGVDYLSMFKNYSNRGYVTMFAEDLPKIVPKTFKDPPADHYLRPFYIAKESMRNFSTSIDAVNDVLKYLENKAFKIGISSPLCYGNRPNHMLLFEYHRQFLEAYRGKLTFSYSWLTELGHDFVNLISYADEDIYNFMKSMHEHGNLNNTVFILMSDHGQRMNGQLRNSQMGRIEDRMPFVSIVIPEHLKHKYPHIHENLKANSEKLTSPFDLHETLRDILLKRFWLVDQSVSPGNDRQQRGISLFRYIPKDRSCYEAKIPDHYCACYAYKSLPLTDIKVKKVAEVVVDYINEKLSKLDGKCEVLELQQIDNAQVLKSNLERRSNEENYNKIEGIMHIINYFSHGLKTKDVNKMYRVTLETKPGNALFEATVKYTELSRRFEVTDRVSRINRYGSQSWCVKDMPIMKTMCYCKNQLVI